jgi:aquaporin related protein
VFQGVAINLVADNPTLANNDPVYGSSIIAAIVCIAVHAALGSSGGMYNPMLASVLVAGCKGHSLLEHVIIYWLGATCGAISTFWIYPTVKNVVYPDPTTTTKKSTSNASVSSAIKEKKSK